MDDRRPIMQAQMVELLMQRALDTTPAGRDHLRTLVETVVERAATAERALQQLLNGSRQAVADALAPEGGLAS